MKKSLKKSAGIVLAVSTAASLGLCGTVYAEENGAEIISDKEADLTMMTYYEGEDDPLASFAYEKVKERFPNVTIEFESQPQDGGQTIKTRAATGDLPDILQSDSGTLGLLAESGSILVLDDYIEEMNYTENLVQGAIQTCLTSPDGHIYEFPIGGVSPILWYYNKALFEEYGVKVPTNYDELLEAVTTFRENDIVPLATFAKEPWPVGALYDSFVLKEDPTGIYGLSLGEARADDEANSHAVEKLKTLIDAGMFQDGCTNADFDTASAMFTEGQCAMFINGSWYIADAEPVLGENLGIFESYPTADAGKEEDNKYAFTGGGDTCGLTITTSAEDPDLCAQVAATYAYWREIAEYQITKSVTVPVKTDGLETNEPLGAASEQLLEMIPNLTYESKFLHTLPNTEFQTSFTEEMQKLLVGESTEDFIANVNKCIDSTTK